MEEDVSRTQPAHVQDGGDDLDHGRALLTVQLIAPAVEISDHLDHERTLLPRAVPAGLARRWKIPVPAGPHEALRIDGQMLRDVVPAVGVDVKITDRLNRGETLELRPCRPPRVVQMDFADLARQVLRASGEKRDKLAGGESADR